MLGGTPPGGGGQQTHDFRCHGVWFFNAESLIARNPCPDMFVCSLLPFHVPRRFESTHLQVIILLKALNVILVPACLKYGDNIIYGYAKPLSIATWLQELRRPKRVMSLLNLSNRNCSISAVLGWSSSVTRWIYVSVLRSLHGR